MSATSASTSATSSKATRVDRIRRALAVGAVLATLPYSVLKIAWLSGSRIGLTDPSFGTSTTMHVLNGATLCLDLVALALALTFFAGVRAPKWFVLPTMWVGYGLLGQLVVLLAPTLLVQLLTTTPAPTGKAASPIEPWVHGAVYTGFSGLGLCLLPAFAVYAWQRWGRERGWGERLADIRHRQLPMLPTALTASVALASALRSGFVDSARDAVGPAADALIGLLAVAAVWADSIGRPGRLPRVAPLATVWIASGAWVAWGVYDLVLGTVPNDLVTDAVPAVDIALAAAKVIAGAVLLLTIPPMASGARVSRP